ncbi:SPOR domain-containing protein [Alcanivorax sp. S6407]|uniref:SPOR domain-containing protein n=1 Tax=Alcanivorax sp. S6407 TaxID=2926424 RepID=UPI001FF32FC5|nr:SPOR domain-containing protein [Alcanivorax sp. S6407]
MEFDEDRFFSGASRGDYLEALTAHAGLGSVVVVDGEAGSGVSTLLGQAVMALLDDLEVVRIDGADDHDGNVVVDALLRHFNIERPELPETLRRTLVDGRIVVVVDNSERLSAEALATMASLKQKLAGRLGYFFGGLPGAIEQIRAAGFTIDDVLSLPELSAEDVQDLAWFVLGLELDDGESAEQCGSAKGNLAAVLEALAPQSHLVAADADDDDMLRFAAHEADDDLDEVDSCDDSGSEGDEAEDYRDKAAPPWRHIAAVAGLLIVVGLLWVGLSSDPEDEAGPRPIALPVPDSVEGAGGESGAEVAAGDADPAERSPMQPTMEPVARLEDLGQSASPSRTDGEVILEPVSDPVMQSDPPPQDTVMTLPDAPEASLGEEPEPAEVKGEEAAPLVDSQGYQHAGWLATLADDRWFLQIMATSQQEGAQQVLDQVGRKGAYYRAERNGKTVWLVLAGDYSSRQAALDAKTSLPSKLQQAGPFPRKMGDIRGEL